MRESKGFTLLEMMIVVAMFAILAAISVSALTPTVNSIDAKSYAQEITRLLKLCRTRAIANTLDHLFVINMSDSNPYNTQDGGIAPNGVSLYSGDGFSLAATRANTAVRWGNESAPEPTGQKGPFGNLGPRLSFVQGLSGRFRTQAVGGIYVDIYSLESCPNNVCPNVPTPKSNVEAFRCRPDGSMSRYTGNIQEERGRFRIYVGNNTGMTANYQITQTGTLSNVEDQYMIDIITFTGKVRLCVGWSANCQ
ncbi:MAG: type II secretion system GspH family protein [Deltaproteobacteria bacterium]|nr:type II secretion system GspH family protein [Deltaproteobacteria bacterium]